VTLPVWLEQPAHRFGMMVANDRVPHALLIQGPKGWGQEMLASHFALSLLNDDLASDARLVAHPDLRWVEPDGDRATLRIVQIRKVCDFLLQTARVGTAKIAVINQADRMTINAANALLKTLEEPGNGSYTLLVTHAPQKLPATVLSRCQRIQVRATDVGVVETWLKKQGYESGAMGQLLAEHGGAPYLTLRALEREERPIWEMLRDVRNEAKSIFDVAAEWRNENLVDLLERWFRHVHLLARESSDSGPLLGFAEMLAEVQIASTKNSGLARQVQLERLLLTWRSLPLADLK
jgi:DNA polymerase-3 subunit delta'